MARADGSIIICTSAFPREDIVNLTLEPDSSGYLVQSRRAALFSEAEMAECRSVYMAKQVVANEIERLMAVLDALDDDADLEPTFAGMDWTGDPRLDEAEGDAPDDERALGGGAADARIQSCAQS